MRASRSGFTILELLLVLAILVMLAAMAFPAIETMYDDMKVQAAADHLRGRLAQARSRAIDDGRAYRIGVHPDTGDYRLAPDSPEFWGDGSAPTQSNDDTYPAPLIDQGTLPGEIVFRFAGNAPASSGGWSTLVSFLATGSAADDCSILLDREGARSIQINVRALTGGVTSKRLLGEANK
jgi:prepilin-type N-terminal cleavage/methylation domain-containing protein